MEIVIILGLCVWGYFAIRSIKRGGSCGDCKNCSANCEKRKNR